MVNRDSKVDNFAIYLFFFLLIIIRCGLRAEIRWPVSMSKSHWSLCVLFSGTAVGLCMYHLFVWSNLNFLHISQCITLPTQSSLVLYSFRANLLHSLILWLMVSSLSHLLFCCVLSILALIWFVLTSSLLLLLSLEVEVVVVFVCIFVSSFLLSSHTNCIK